MSGYKHQTSNCYKEINVKKKHLTNIKVFKQYTLPVKLSMTCKVIQLIAMNTILYITKMEKKSTNHLNCNLKPTNKAANYFFNIELSKIINTTLPSNMADGRKIINKIMPHSNKHRCTVKPWEVLLGILGGVVPPSSQILPLFTTKNCHFELTPDL